MSPYTSVATLLIESTALYAIRSLVFIVVYLLNNPRQYIMTVTLCPIQVYVLLSFDGRAVSGVDTDMTGDQLHLDRLQSIKRAWLGAIDVCKINCGDSDSIR